MKLDVFTDGGGFPQKNERGFDAASNFRVLQKVDGEMKLIKRYVDITTSQTMAYAEIHAIHEAFKYLIEFFTENGVDKDTVVELYTDSRNCHMTLTAWIYNWMKKAGGLDKEWKSSSNVIVANQEEIRATYKAKLALEKMNVHLRLFHINSHVLDDPKKRKKLDFFHEQFQLNSRKKVSKEEYMYLLTQNRHCDKDLNEFAKAYYKEKSKL